MALLYTDIAANQAGNVNTLASLTDPALTAGRDKLITAVYTMTGAEVAADIINIVKIPSGALVDPISGNMAGNGIATTATVSVGDTDTVAGTVTADASRYSAAQSVAANNVTVGVPFSGGTQLTAPAQVTDDWVFLTATFATLTVPVAGKKLVFRVKVSQLD
jgi:hypothetical protein